MTLSNQALHDIAVAKQLYLDRLKKTYAIDADALLVAFLSKVTGPIIERIQELNFAQMSPGTFRTLRADLTRIELAHRAGFRKKIDAIFFDFMTQELDVQLGVQFAHTGETEATDRANELTAEGLWRKCQQAIIGEQGEQLGVFTELAAAGAAVHGRRALGAAYVAGEPASDVIARLRGIRKPLSRNVATLVDTGIQSIVGTIAHEVR